MANFVEKLSYLASSGLKKVRRVGGACPNCKAAVYDRVAQKFVVTELRRCLKCQLLYRAPTDDAGENDRFYQVMYQQGFTTELPSNEELARFKAHRFKGTNKDYSRYVDLLGALGIAPGRRVLDFGCSWGYGSWQFTEAGYDVVAYEISKPRAAYAAEKLNVRMFDRQPVPADVSDHRETFDVFFSSHVVEHVPQPGVVVELAQALLKPGGYFVAVTPNGSEAFRKADAASWQSLWGKVHPNFLDAEYWLHTFPDRPLLLSSTPEDVAAVTAFGDGVGRPNDVSTLTGHELLCIARL